MDPNNLSAGDWGLIVGVTAVVIGVLLAVFAVLGYSMKWSLASVGVGRVGFLRALAIVLAMTSVTFVVQLIFTVGIPSQWWAASLYSCAASVLVIAVFARCNPLRAFLAYIVHSIYATLGLVGLFLLMVLFALPFGKDNLTHFQSTLEQRVKTIAEQQGNEMATASVFGGDEPGSDAVGDDELQARRAARREIDATFFAEPTRSTSVGFGTATRASSPSEKSRSTGSRAAAASGSGDRPPANPSETTLPPGVQRNPFAE